MPPKAKAAKAKARPGGQAGGQGAGARQRSKPPAASPEPPKLQRLLSDSVIECFRRFDEKGDGKITRSELARLLERLAPGEFDCKALLDVIDRNGDGIIDYVEFCEWVMVGGDDAEKVRKVAPGAELPQEQLDRCIKELAECEAAISPKPVEIQFEQADNLGIRYGRGDERRANIVMRVVENEAAHSRGVRAGWHVVAVAGREVTGTVYVPDLIMEGQRTGGVSVKFVTPEELDRQRAAEFRLPELLAALDIAKKRHDAAAQPLEAVIPAGKVGPATPAAAGPATATANATAENAAPTDAAAALAKYNANCSAAAYVPSYEELQEAMGKELWTAEKFRFGMGPQEWLEMMGVATVEQDDPYKVLGVESDATQQQIKTAFMALAREFHPDKFPEEPEAAEARFDRIKKAYDRVRAEDIRAKTDSKLGITDFFTLFSSENRAERQKMMNQTNLMILDDPDALPKEAGMDDELRARGTAAVKYYHYKLPFVVSDGRLTISEIDQIYALSDTFPGCGFLLAEWRPGDCHLLRPGDQDTGESPLLPQEGGCFCDVRPGMTYHLLVQEKDDGK